MSKSRKKFISAALCGALTCFCLLAGAFTVRADDAKKITRVSLTLDADIGRNRSNEVKITSNSSGYMVSDYELAEADNGDFWASSEYPRIIIYLSAEDGYEFRGISKSKVNLKGDSYRCVSVRTPNSEEMVITADLKPYGRKVGVPLDVHWSDQGRAAWGSGYRASKYEVTLRQGRKKIHTASLSGTSFDFSSYMETGKTYTFQVRTGNGDGAYSNWITSEEQVYQGGSSNTSVTVGTSGGPGVGAWVLQDNRWWYRNADGTYPANGWYYLPTQTGEKWFYFDQEGWMLSDTVTPDGYRVGADGAWIQ